MESSVIIYNQLKDNGFHLWHNGEKLNLIGNWLMEEKWELWWEV